MTAHDRHQIGASRAIQFVMGMYVEVRPSGQIIHCWKETLSAITKRLEVFSVIYPMSNGHMRARINIHLFSRVYLFFVAQTIYMQAFVVISRECRAHCYIFFSCDFTWDLRERYIPVRINTFLFLFFCLHCSKDSSFWHVDT